MKKITVVIVSYKVKDYLCQCLLSLRRALVGIDAEVCVVDNHSDDGTVDFLRENFPEIKVIAKKLLAVRDTIAIMRQRGETVTTMFYEAKRAVEAEVAKINDNFTPIFTTRKENA